MSRNRRTGERQFLLFHAETTIGWRVIRRISFAQGEDQVRCGAYREVYDENNQHIGYQVLPERIVPASVGSAMSVVSITRSVIFANAGLCGKSRTARMNDEQRENRIHPKTGKRLPAEDFIEKAQIKVKHYMTIPLTNPKHVEWASR